LPTSLKDAPPHRHAELGKLIARHVTSQNRVDQMMANLQSPADFAQPLLETALKSQFGLEPNVRKTPPAPLHPHPPTLATVEIRAARIWTVSLLDAAHTTGAETRAASQPTSTYITTPSADGRFETLPQIAEKCHHGVHPPVPGAGYRPAL
jgi:hypothetical protein